MICFKCQKETGLIEPVGRRDECPHCGADARVCKNCEFYDIKVYNECREPKGERVLEKDRSNFCDQFTPGGQKFGDPANPKADPKSLAEALFKKK